MHIPLCKRMKVSYNELMATPALIIQDHLLDMTAEGAAASVKDRWSNR